LATVAAIRGDEATAQRFALDADRRSIPLRDSVAAADACIARGIASVGNGRYTDAVSELSGLFQPGAATSGQRLLVIGHFAEAGIRSGRGKQVEAALEMVEGDVPATVLERSGEIAFARAVIADSSASERAYRELLLERHEMSPFFQARARLSLGMYLRRARRITDAREPLAAAATGFEAIGAVQWASRAREELRAAGVQHRPGTGTLATLTPQELLIAQMAAAGLSNKEIGRRLIVSPRTVGAHLYRTFPKLGVSSRGELNRALAGNEASIAS
jgi:DNA-binding NarL/FixJ family response regulator